MPALSVVVVFVAFFSLTVIVTPYFFTFTYIDFLSSSTRNITLAVPVFSFDSIVNTAWPSASVSRLAGETETLSLFLRTSAVTCFPSTGHPFVPITVTVTSSLLFLSICNLTDDTVIFPTVHSTDDTTWLTAVTSRGAPLVFISSVQPTVNVSPLNVWMRSLSNVESLLTRMDPLNVPVSAPVSVSFILARLMEDVSMAAWFRSVSSSVLSRFSSASTCVTTAYEPTVYNSASNTRVASEVLNDSVFVIVE